MLLRITSRPAERCSQTKSKCVQLSQKLSKLFNGCKLICGDIRHLESATISTEQYQTWVLPPQPPTLNSAWIVSPSLLRLLWQQKRWQGKQIHMNTPWPHVQGTRLSGSNPCPNLGRLQHRTWPEPESACRGLPQLIWRCVCVCLMWFGYAWVLRQRVSPGADSFILQTGFIQRFHKKNKVRFKKSAAVVSSEMSPLLDVKDVAPFSPHIQEHNLLTSTKADVADSLKASIG